jgi:hypothetical protein
MVILGNDMQLGTTSRRLLVDGRNTIITMLWDVWHTGDGSVSLLYDPNYDTNLRAAWTYQRSSTQRWAFFTKVADMILDGALKDQDDFPVIRDNLHCSIKGTACPR